LAWFVYSQWEEAVRKRNPGPQLTDFFNKNKPDFQPHLGSTNTIQQSHSYLHRHEFRAFFETRTFIGVGLTAISWAS